MTARYHAIKLLLDVATAFAPRGERSETAELETPGGCREVDLEGWECSHLPSRTIEGFEHRYYHHRASKPGAPAIVLLHGLFLDGRSYFNLKPLARDYELFAYDYPGSWSGYRGKLEDFRTLLEDFTAALELERFVLVGVSFGGMVALNWAAHLPRERVSAVVLISTRIHGYTAEGRRQFHEMAKLVERYGDEQLDWIQQKAEALYLRRFRGEEREQMKKVLQPKSIPFYRQAMASLDGRNGDQDARRVRQPLLYLLGTDDDLMPVESAEEIRAEIPQAQIELIEGGNHTMSYLDGERLSKKIDDYLSGLEL